MYSQPVKVRLTKALDLSSYINVLFNVLLSQLLEMTAVKLT